MQANGRKLRSANSACLFGHRAPIDQPAHPRYKLGRCQHNIISWKDLTMIIRPFEALRSTPDSAAAVASVPYDVVDATEARRLAEGNLASFLHVLRSEIDLPEGTDPYSDAVYDKARENLQMLISGGQMVREAEQTGRVCRAQLPAVGMHVPVLPANTIVARTIELSVHGRIMSFPDFTDCI